MFASIGFPDPSELHKMPGLFDACNGHTTAQTARPATSKDHASEDRLNNTSPPLDGGAYGADAAAMVTLARQRLDPAGGSSAASSEHAFQVPTKPDTSLATASSTSTKPELSLRQQEANAATSNIVQLAAKLRNYCVPDPGALRSLHNIPDDISSYLPPHMLQSYKQVHVMLAKYQSAEEQDVKWRHEAELAKLDKMQTQQRTHLLAQQQKQMVDDRWHEFPSSLQEQLHASIFDKVQAMNAHHHRIRSELVAKLTLDARLQGAAILKRYADWRWWQNLLILRQYPPALEALSLAQNGCAANSLQMLASQQHQQQTLNPAMLAAAGLNPTGLQQLMMQSMAGMGGAGQEAQQQQLLQQQLMQQQQQEALVYRSLQMQGAGNGPMAGLGDYLTANADQLLGMMRMGASSHV